ncbi:helix-turn-helix domain-containing protein [Marinilactibacillus kalidii]|uniref:helix-turn-helix domain-containing protein n=1 Tax=Marinilactibacillus kalidii TaxID=2820274 RepID=UPI001ABEE3ED|nr:helix-turn-helix transcriptional regulator [Marinilactibacillus kalidii]
MEFPEKLKKLRLEKGYSQTALANELFVTRQAISKWERGLSNPDHETLKKISKLLEVSIDTLLNKGPLLSNYSEPVSFTESTVKPMHDQPYIPVKSLEEKTSFTKDTDSKWLIAFRSLGADFFIMSLIALIPVVIHPVILLISFPLMLLAYYYKKKRIYYVIAIMGSFLFVSLETYGYFGEKYGWFTTYEVILLEDEPLEDPDDDPLLENDFTP